MFMLMSHYRSPLNYSGEILEQTKNALERLSTAKANLEFFKEKGADGPMTEAEAEFAASLGKFREKFCQVMDDDLNTADAVAVIFELVREINTAVSPSANPTKALAAECDKLFMELSDVIGLPLSQPAADDMDSEIESLIQQRQDARKAKNWAEADRIRDELKAQGIILEDTPQGVKWKRA